MRAFAIVSLLFLAGHAIGQETTNPFQTPSSAPIQSEPPPAAVTTLDTFQFNGMLKMDGKVRISLFDTKTNRNVWLTEEEIGEFGLSFQRFDEQNETVVVAQGGISKKLALNKVKIEELKVATPRKTPDSPPAVANTTARPNNNARVETDEEARARIQRVAEEIRRRRAERRKKLEAQSR